ncbi:MAG: PIN/TRAM domain-containing protein [Planctomycetes bacterium]|nr:PIN/TRAM domain-containing protein [Planctomycetota bacterium]
MNDNRENLPSLPSAIEQTETTRLSLLRISRLAFFALFVVVTTLSVLYFRPDQAVPKEWPRVALVILAIAFLIAAIVGSVDLLTRKKKIGAVFAVFFGIAAAMLATAAIGSVVDLLASLYEIDPRITSATKVLLGIALAYLAVTTILQTQDDFRLVIPYVEFAKQIRGTKPLILDSSALIDARIVDIASTGLLQSPVVIPRFVVLELQRLSDSSDRLTRTKGRRGLDMVTRLQRLGTVSVSIDELLVPGKAVDQMLIEFARLSPGLIVTTDMGLARVAEIQNIRVINLHEIANALKPALIPGEPVSVVLVRAGEQPGQGVGYLDDGTMVVAENCGHLLGERVALVVSSNLQTAAGRLVFAKPATKELKTEQPELPATEVAADAANGETPAVETPVAPEPVASSANEGEARPRSPYPPNPPRSVRTGTPRNPRR